jgi:ATP phosphoribosyltransferase regulatory subunit
MSASFARWRRRPVSMRTRGTLLLQLLQAKDVPSLARMLPPRRALALGAAGLPELYGGVETSRRRPGCCPPCRKSRCSGDLAAVAAALPDLPLSFDLADLRGYHYHNGVVFAAYCPAFSSAIARGGRYDGVGKAFGRERPATGFSMDLRELARLAAAGAGDGGNPGARTRRPMRLWRDDCGCCASRARSSSNCCRARPAARAACDRQLVERDGQWLIEAINRDGSP